MLLSLSSALGTSSSPGERPNRLSLARKLYALLLLAALPLALVSAYQAWSGWRSAGAIAGEFPRYVLATGREAQFKVFVDGMADAVDSGSLSEKAQKAALETRRLSNELQVLGEAAPPELAQEIGAIAAAVEKSRDLATLMPLRASIMGARKAIAEQAERHHATLDGIVNGSIAGARRDAAIALAIVALSIGAALGVGRRLIASILGVVLRLREAADSIAAESQRLASEARQARERAAGEARELEAVSRAMAAMLADIDAVTADADATAAAALQTRRVAAQAEHFMQANSKSQAAMQGRVDASTEAIRTLSRAIGSIGEITNAIRQVAHQTNLLAINASIEAARAGTQGKGFAVVATEVRHLAEATSSSTGDIRARVETVERDAGQAVTTIASVTASADEIGRGIEGTLRVLQEIVAAAGNLDELAAHISRSAAQQSEAARHVVGSMEQMRGLARASGGGIELVGDASRSLVRTAQALQAQVAQLAGG